MKHKFSHSKLSLSLSLSRSHTHTHLFNTDSPRCEPALSTHIRTVHVYCLLLNIYFQLSPAIYTLALTHTNTQTHLYSILSICMYAHTHTQTHTNTHTQTHTHTHTHTHTLTQKGFTTHLFLSLSPSFIHKHPPKPTQTKPPNRDYKIYILTRELRGRVL